MGRRRRNNNRESRQFDNRLERSGNSRVRVNNEAESLSASLSAAIAAALEAQVQRKLT